ncbi:MAG: YdcF family protein [Synechococcus sp.]|nr:YdcF family protein [Synechococcus sp.]
MGARWWWIGTAGVLGMACAGPLLPYRQALFTSHPPERILVLGGDVDREKAGLKLARSLQLPLVVSGGSNPEYAHWLMVEEGLSESQVALDYRAEDTLSNFTTLVDDLRAAGVQHVLLVTSEDHLPRALTVGSVVAGSRGIRLTGVPVSCGVDCVRESPSKLWGDGFRSLAWVLTGRDLKPWARAQWERLVSKP